MDEHGVELLVYAIVRRAAVDYQMALDGKLLNKWNTNEIERFFKSSWFETLMPNVSGPLVIQKLKDNYRLHGVTVFEAELL